MTDFVTSDLNGGLFRGKTDLNLDLSDAVVVWAWSNSSNSWLRQSGASRADWALQFVKTTHRDCPDIRVAFTPCLPA